jgi:uncharacterized protein (DUF4415 family)
LESGREAARRLRPEKKPSACVDADVLDAFKSTGEGWQTRMNGILRAAILPGRKSAHNDEAKSKRRRA